MSCAEPLYNALSTWNCVTLRNCLNSKAIYCVRCQTAPHQNILFGSEKIISGGQYDEWDSLVFPLKFNIELQSEKTDMKLLFGDLEIESRYIETFVKLEKSSVRRGVEIVSKSS